MTKQELISQGLELSALGIVVVFIALTLVVILIFLLQMGSIWKYNKARWLNRVASNLEETVEAIDNVVFPEVKDEIVEEENLRRVAGIAVVLVRKRAADTGRDKNPTLGQLLEQRFGTPLEWRGAEHVSSRSQDLK